MTTVRLSAAIALLAVAAVGCSKDKTAGNDKPAVDAAKADPVAKVDAAAKPSAVDAAAAPVIDAAAGDPPDKPGKPDAGSATKLDPDLAQNIKLLPKAWGVKKIKKFMKTYNKALGVKCKFCHDVKDYAADRNKHKGMARKMMAMTRSTNKKFFKGKQVVKCITCHRGKAELE